MRSKKIGVTTIIVIIIFIVALVLLVRHFLHLQNLTEGDLIYKEIVVINTYNESEDNYYELRTKDNSYTIEKDLVSYSVIRNLTEKDLVVIGIEYDSYSIITLEINNEKIVTFEDFQEDAKNDLRNLTVFVPVFLVGTLSIFLIVYFTGKKNKEKDSIAIQNEDINETVYNELINCYKKVNGNEYFLYKEMFVDKFEKTVSKGFMDLISENTVTFFKVLYDENDDLNTLTSYLLLYKREGKLYYDELNIEVDEDFSIYDTFTEWSYPPYQKVTEEELKDYKSAFEYSKAMYPELFNK